MSVTEIIGKIVSVSDTLTPEQLKAIASVIDCGARREPEPLTVREYATRNKVHKNTVHNMIASGRLIIKRVGKNRIRIIGEAA